MTINEIYLEPHYRVTQQPTSPASNHDPTNSDNRTRKHASSDHSTPGRAPGNVLFQSLPVRQPLRFQSEQATHIVFGIAGPGSVLCDLLLDSNRVST